MNSITHATGPTPPEAPLEMPTQALDRAPGVRFPWSDMRTMAARLIAFGGAALLTWYGFQQMMLVFGSEVRTTLQGVLLVFFVVTFGWIAFSACSATAGILLPPRRRRIGPDVPLRGRTALLMPVYNEDVATTCGALRAMGEALAERGHGQDFEIFIVSDSRDPLAWVRETAAFGDLRQALAGRMAVWYRRRVLNTGRKAGNLRDFVERWGGRYDYMLVLDADSLMAPETILEMVRRMDAAPKLGILQTVPALAFGRSVMARLQQFAGRAYGPAIARGVAAWQGLDGNYWGHNALIRVHAFAENCGLPELRGRMPFGGHVLSHDFVEAALIRRGGWEVRMDPDLEGSWEGAPPSLLDLAARDRRWAQGNLQHIKVIGTAGLRWPNRVHFLIGIGSYLMSPIWLAMLVTGLVLTGQALIFRPEYFPESYQLFPRWPVFDAARMTWLFVLAILLLLLPKLYGVLISIFEDRRRRAFGGALRIVRSALVEIVLSALYAPVLMLLQVRQVFEILAGRDSGWSAQSREGAAMPWREAIARHWRHVTAGILPAIGIAYLAPDQLIWLSPVLAGLAIAPILSRMSGDPRTGLWMREWGLIEVPEEREEPDIFATSRAARGELRETTALNLGDFWRSPPLRSRHIAALGPVPADEPAMLAAITARAKIEVAPTPEQALAWMTRDEQVALFGSGELLEFWSRNGLGELAAAR